MYLEVGVCAVRRVLLLLFLVALAGCLPAKRGLSPTAQEEAAQTNATVVDVIDGDTVRLRLESGEEIVRLLGVDTPETVDPNRPAQCFGAEASAYLGALLPTGTHVYLARDQQTRDVFGRLLGYVFVGSENTLVNLELIRNGYADTLSIAPNTTYRTIFAAALRDAKGAEVGLWGRCDGADQPLTGPEPNRP